MPESHPSPEQAGSLTRMTAPSGYMAEYGVDPHESHEIDVAGIVRDLAQRADSVSRQVAAAFDADKTTNWRDYSRQLTRRIRGQRREIKRLHTKVRELRADIHERDERIRELEASA